ncbi:MAG: hypothetical protein A3J48_00185 [Candidatus Doudnabacteria bacterium RIFCSPHIGHO2_02_FULL_46_11]|uniref:DUF4446 domain-containing protein n=1 Tax=Candidatus Doudnabacteria bacterium RIFCSPHIGHO2_02_FULL_46_11 TaxID=1817832 RepID=A0A1F5P6Y0_9BACT|nr:MAG: hypothetical protein A3J48_00185 [Candidatus Doudnabacteria bacterium RIFCSPHIGHO2_02_FULL_46_11]
MQPLLIVSLVLTVLALILSAWNFWSARRNLAWIQKLFTETGHEQFGEVLLSHQRQLRRDQESLKALDERLKQVEGQSVFLLNQVGLVRYNPFSDSGGNMSFSLALINDNGDGAIITGLHSREGMRMYSKSVKNYKSDQVLTDEEIEAVDRARRGNKS